MVKTVEPGDFALWVAPDSQSGEKNLICVCSASNFALFVSLCIAAFFFKQKTAYEIYRCDWSSDVCSSDLNQVRRKLYLSNFPSVNSLSGISIW